MEEMCSNIIDVLLKSKAIKSDPTDGQPTVLYYDGIMKKLFNSSWHPGFGQEDVRSEGTMMALSDEEWKSLKPAGTLDVPRLVFARGTSRLTALSEKTLDDLATKLETWKYYLVVRGNVAKEGDVEANRILAEARAQAAVDYLVNKGVDRNRIHAETSHPNGSSTVAFILGELPY
jgi:outer membrane protein OmpA-like peptidoglycan-associated protein